MVINSSSNMFNMFICCKFLEFVYNNAKHIHNNINMITLHLFRKTQNIFSVMKVHIGL